MEHEKQTKRVQNLQNFLEEQRTKNIQFHALSITNI